MDKKLKRKNVYVSEEVNEWLEKESEKTGLSQAAIMLTAINVYMRQTQLPGQIDILQELARKLDKEKEA